MTSTSLAELATQFGLEESYHDYRGQHRVFSDAARRAILDAMGAFATQSTRAATAQVASLDQPVITLPALSAAPLRVALTLLLEAGGTRTCELSPQVTAEGAWSLTLPTDLPAGYHRYQASAAGQEQNGWLAITPTRCYEPLAMQSGQRCWGLSIQLYSLRSAHNLGIGDFADLQDLIRAAAPLGCATIGLNPLHALRPADPAHISPYSPSHREFLNVWYIAVQRVPGYHSTAAQQFLSNHKDTLQALRAQNQVDYPGMAQLKLRLLRILFVELKQDVTRLKAFRDYVKAQGEALYQHALYDALDAHFSALPQRHWGWRSWPADYHDPNSAAVRVFATQRASEVEFYLYLQWLAATQLAETQALARELGMSLGLYADVAVGVDANGSEVWSNRALYLDQVSIGAPPDPLALKGQEWGIPPQHPLRLRQQDYQPFIRMLRANMRSAGALRIDHVMTLCRLWWVARGFDATDGVYVRYPLQDLVRLVALESQRQQCLVIGEDLGTVPDAMRAAMHTHGLYHYKVLFFEKTAQGQFLAPHDYVDHALAVVTTHDLPPFRSWWQGDDITLRRQLALYPDAASAQQVERERESDRVLLMQALVQAGLWHWQQHEPVPAFSFALMRAAYLYAGLARARLLVIQPEDLQQMIAPVNVPGTSTQHANWQRKLAEDLLNTLQRDEVRELCSAMNKARRGEFPN